MNKRSFLKLMALVLPCALLGIPLLSKLLPPKPIPNTAITSELLKKAARTLEKNRVKPLYIEGNFYYRSVVLNENWMVRTVKVFEE